MIFQSISRWSIFRTLANAVDIPTVPASPPKSPLRLRFETEWADAFNLASRALCFVGLGLLSGVLLLLSALLRKAEKWHAALARKSVKVEADFSVSAQTHVPRMEAH